MSAAPLAAASYNARASSASTAFVTAIDCASSVSMRTSLRTPPASRTLWLAVTSSPSRASAETSAQTTAAALAAAPAASASPEAPPSSSATRDGTPPASHTRAAFSGLADACAAE
eukprot:4714943-Prymnesium_polylepis.1